jgi:hypothetical protein
VAVGPRRIQGQSTSRLEFSERSNPVTFKVGESIGSTITDGVTYSDKHPIWLQTRLPRNEKGMGASYEDAFV